ncbi:DUF2573 family protein [Peribacillus sp. SCS-155]|uniref:DUF2573 family protein n=1 Tax=Peribacillus sedimenti TaxID=3115297 RepID=UPI003905764F
MNEEFKGQFEALLSKYTELMTGTNGEELEEKVRYWVLYTYIAKTMPALAKHWNALYPKGKEQMMEIISEIKVLNENHRNKRD